MSTDFRIVIPARYASTRLPGKPLLDLGGKPMVVRVAERALASGAIEVVVATDDGRVAAAVREHGLAVELTRTDHPTGTDRLAEVVAARGWDNDALIVNVQGDEPLIEPELIAATARQLADSGAAIATVAHPLVSVEDFFNPNFVKLVCASNGDALYFSRAPIPYPRDAFSADRTRLPAGLSALRHVGLYAYRAAFLRAYPGLSPVAAETWESLEQLRALAHGYRISVLVSETLPVPGVDTPADAERVRAMFDRALDSE